MTPFRPRRFAGFEKVPWLGNSKFKVYTVARQISLFGTVVENGEKSTSPITELDFVPGSFYTGNLLAFDVDVAVVGVITEKEIMQEIREDEAVEEELGVGRHAGEGGRGEHASLLPFSWRSRESKSTLFKCNDLLSNC